MFEVEETPLTKIHYYKQKNAGVNDPATYIKHLLFHFDKRDQLVVVHRNAESKVNPPHYSKLSRLCFHMCQLEPVENIVSYKNNR